MVDDNEDFSEDHIIQKPNTSSSIWKYFGVKADSNNIPIPDEVEKSICKLCNKTISAKQSNTTNLQVHLR